MARCMAERIENGKQKKTFRVYSIGYNQNEC